MNVTVVSPTASGYLTVWPTGTTMPATSTMTFNAGVTTATFAVSKLAADGTVSIYNPYGNTDVILDVAGWFGPAATGTFQATTPTRVLDTRPAYATGSCLTACATIPSGGTLNVRVADRNGLPPAQQITAVTANITVVPTVTTAAGYVTVWPGNTPKPLASNVNFNPGQTAVANATVVKLGPDGTLSIYALGTAVDVLIDIQGWYTAPTATTTYAYDADGLRTTKTTAGITTPFTWDRSSQLPNLLSDGANTFIYGPDGLPHEQIDNGNNVSWLHHDQLGSTRLITNTTGAVTGAALYDPYGTPTTQVGTTTPLGYTGQYTDPETGLQYLRNRYYDPATAQFLTRDPIFSATRSAYGYVDGNPLNAVDPSGLAVCWVGVCVSSPFDTNPLRGKPLSQPLGEKGDGTIVDLLPGAPREPLIQDIGRMSLGPAIKLLQPPRDGIICDDPQQGGTRSGDLPARGAPGTSGVKDDGNGNGQIRDFGPDGRAIRDFDFGHDHGAGDPHVHDWNWSQKPERQPGRPLRPGE